MQVTITEYPSTRPGVPDGSGGVRGGIFAPSNIAKAPVVHTVTPTGVGGSLLDESGDGWRVQVLEVDRRGTVFPVTWISATDVDGTVHTVEYKVADYPLAEFGFVSVAIA